MQIVSELQEIIGRIESEFITDKNNLEEEIIYTPDYVIGKLKEIKTILNCHDNLSVKEN